MRLRDETPLDPDVAASLDAIDAVLAGEPVDPRHAELAELALLLAGERPEPNSAFTTLLGEGVERRFTAPRSPARAPSTSRRRWFWGPLAGLATAAVVAVLVVVSAGPGQSPRSALTVPSSSASSAGTAKVPAAAATPAIGVPRRLSSTPTAKQTSSPSANQAVSPGQAVVLQPPPNGRKIIQGAQLALGTAPSRVDAVAQEVFDVVGQERGIVNSSTVTAAGGPGGYAQFQLNIPSAVLPQTMAALSSLRYAEVTSRTDTTQDVNDQYQSDVRALADARALRTSLLKQLAAATTQTQIDSLTAQIHDADASISSDEATLRSLGNRIDYSQVTLTINGGPVPVPVPSSSGGGFTLHQAAHDAGRVLTVVAGVALIGAAALVPVALFGALAWWIATAIRRRRREQGLDMV